MQEKYSIYDSDLKYKKLRNIDPSKINWESEEQQKLFYEENTDSLDYRLKECIEKNNGDMLDLSHMELKQIPILPENVTRKIKYLFLNNNNLNDISGIEKYINMEVLDIEYNNIASLAGLPKGLIELNCKYNQIVNIPHIEKLVRLECGNNKIWKLCTYENLETLSCSENRIQSFPPYPRIRKLICEKNMVNIIENYPTLEYLNCSYNNVEKIADCPKLVDMLCRNNKLKELPDGMSNLKYLEIFNNKISKLYYYPNLKELFCDSDGISQISKMYRIEKSNVYSNEKCYITFK